MKRKHQSDMKSLLLPSGAVLMIGFLLNLIWEKAQAPLYQEYSGFFGHFSICFIASIVDALVLLLLYNLFAMSNHSPYRPLYVKLRQYGLLSFASGVITVYFYNWALAVEQWVYTDDMPMVPLIHVGWLPLL
ncbi:hypothetical protein C8N40_11320 [Pontibacter mucosus]|uniref:Uncharacterized protein n=1 Tax=Pontibacter mucosus TaxID=1649266 RepID=A0A2T5Y9P3_9BACT|nr:hypothetical protein [Pontibacter mucosus]PTX13098.1 hypothetical protein C8N40_11320 [Pontibacter mucosus]